MAKVERVVDDAEYLTYMRSMYLPAYGRWKKQHLEDIEDIVADLRAHTLEEVMKSRDLTPRDVALLVRLKYFTEAEVEEFSLQAIERSVPA